jgi:hypothetical protein
LCGSASLRKWIKYNFSPSQSTPTDESVEVEQQTQTVITTIEGIVGESIQQYF